MHTSLEIQSGMAIASNYNKIIFNQFEEFLGDRILETGCSLGNLTRMLLENTDAGITATDVLPEALEKLGAENALHHNRLHRCIWDLNQAPAQLVSARKYSSILCVNVLEHVCRDDLAIGYFYNLLEDGGYLFLLVPAHPFLYGSVDRSDHHFRRYRKSELIAMVNYAGFNIYRTYYFNMFGIAAWLWMGRVLKKRKLSDSSIGWYNAMFPYLYKIEEIFSHPAGQSIILVAKK